MVRFKQAVPSTILCPARVIKLPFQKKSWSAPLGTTVFNCRGNGCRTGIIHSPLPSSDICLPRVSTLSSLHTPAFRFGATSSECVTHNACYHVRVPSPIKAKTKTSYIILVILTVPFVVGVASLLFFSSLSDFPNDIIAEIAACLAAVFLVYICALLISGLFITVSLDRRLKAFRVPYLHATDTSPPGTWSEVLWLFQPICSRPRQIPFSATKCLLICRPEELKDYARIYEPGSIARAIVDWQLNPVERHKFSNFLRLRTFFAPDLIFALETRNNLFVFRSMYTLRISDMFALAAIAHSEGVKVVGTKDAASNVLH
jgi:hypothetical protein